MSDHGLLCGSLTLKKTVFLFHAQFKHINLPGHNKMKRSNIYLGFHCIRLFHIDGMRPTCRPIGDFLIDQALYSI